MYPDQSAHLFLAGSPAIADAQTSAQVHRPDVERARAALAGAAPFVPLASADGTPILELPPELVRALAHADLATQRRWNALFPDHYFPCELTSHAKLALEKGCRVFLA